MTLPELSACPFCGGEARLTNGGTGNYYVRCTACAANTDDGSRDRAIAAWNTRTGQLVERDGVAGVVELLDDLETEADLCRNEGADDIAALLDRAIAALTAIKGGDDAD